MFALWKIGILIKIICMNVCCSENYLNYLGSKNFFLLSFLSQKKEMLHLKKSIVYFYLHSYYFLIWLIPLSNNFLTSSINAIVLLYVLYFLGKEEKGNKESLSGKIDDSVLYVQLPDGYPVITGQYYFQGWQSGQKIGGFRILLRIFCMADSDSGSRIRIPILIT